MIEINPSNFNNGRAVSKLDQIIVYLKEWALVNGNSFQA